MTISTCVLSSLLYSCSCHTRTMDVSTRLNVSRHRVLSWHCIDFFFPFKILFYFPPIKITIFILKKNTNFHTRYRFQCLYSVWDKYVQSSFLKFRNKAGFIKHIDLIEFDSITTSLCWLLRRNKRIVFRSFLLPKKNSDLIVFKILF